MKSTFDCCHTFASGPTTNAPTVRLESIAVTQTTTAWRKRQITNRSANEKLTVSHWVCALESQRLLCSQNTLMLRLWCTWSGLPVQNVESIMEISREKTCQVYAVWLWIYHLFSWFAFCHLVSSFFKMHSPTTLFPHLFFWWTLPDNWSQPSIKPNIVFTFVVCRYGDLAWFPMPCINPIR